MKSFPSKHLSNHDNVNNSIFMRILNFQSPYYYHPQKEKKAKKETPYYC